MDEKRFIVTCSRNFARYIKEKYPDFANAEVLRFHRDYQFSDYRYRGFMENCGDLRKNIEKIDGNHVIGWLPMEIAHFPKTLTLVPINIRGCDPTSVCVSNSHLQSSTIARFAEHPFMVDVRRVTI